MNKDIHTGNKYHRPVVLLEQYDTPMIDVYRVLDAFGVTNPGIQHSVKKELCAGLRGKAELIQDLEESQDAITEAIKIAKAHNPTEVLFAAQKKEINSFGFKAAGDIEIGEGEEIIVNFEERTIEIQHIDSIVSTIDEISINRTVRI